MGGNVLLQIGMQGEQAAAFDQRLLRQQHAAHVGVHDDRVGRLVGKLRPDSERDLQAFARVAQREFW
jgi:hypothetical protein